MPRGRPSAPTFIVEPAEVLATAVILEENWTFLSLARFVNEDDPLSVLRWLARRGLVRNTLLCTTCNGECAFISYSDGIDKYRWSCKECNLRFSVRKDSFFSGSHLPLWKILVMMYCWCRDMSQLDITHEAQLGSCRNTVVDWCNFFRDVCEEWLVQNPSEIGGMDDNGDPIDVEIDESFFFHRKYHRGQWRDGHWVFGGVERHSGRCFMVEVPDRTAPTLENIVTQYILPGSRIISDGWRAYGNLGNLRGGIYIHDTINHTENFVDPDDATVHTQHIENTWMRVKRQIRRRFGTSVDLFPTYLAEFMWKNAHKDKKMFSAFITAVRSQYRL